jgi:phosphohistidine phosphatase
MKSIFLVRHATAQIRETDLPDFERSLIKKGKKESRKMAQRFLKYQIKPAIWISSPAPRAWETAQIFADVLDYPHEKILKEDALYDENSSKPYIELINSLPTVKDSVIFFGHDPGITETAVELAINFQLDFPKAGIVAISFLESSWKKLTNNEGFLTLIEFPGSRKGISRILEQNLTRLVNRQSETIISSLTPKLTGKMKKTIISFSGKIAQELVSYRKKNI